jgi:hypothetical protein
MLLTGAKLAESIGWPSHFDALREKSRAVHATIAALLAGARNRLMCHKKRRIAFGGVPQALQGLTVIQSKHSS